MTQSISKSKFKAHALEIFREIESTGMPVLITDHGRPALEVRPYQATDPLEQLKGSVLKLDQPFEPVTPEDWESLR